MKISKLLAAGTVVLAVMSSSASAFASTGDTSSTPSATDTSTTLPPKRDREAAAKFRTDMLAWQVSFSKWVADRAAAVKDHRDAIASASATMTTAVNSATTKEARKAALDAFKAASKQAKEELDAALAEIGERPARPSR